MSTAHNEIYTAVTTALEAGLPLTERPTMWSAIDAICDAMRFAGRTELVHYAGACYRDDVAWQMCIAWQADRAADEATLKQRALLAAGWGHVPVEHIRATAAR